MPYDYSLLLGKITEKYGTRAKFAKAMGVSMHTISLKLNEKIVWKQDEIAKACGLLNIRMNEIARYFFVLKVQKIEQTV